MSAIKSDKLFFCIEKLLGDTYNRSIVIKGKGDYMIYTITLNPSLDYVLKVDGFEQGKVNRSKEEKILAGGKGINVTTVLKNLGCESVALGFIAGWTGNEIEHILRDKGIKTNFININDGMSRINVKLRSNKETEINAKGPNVGVDNLEKLFKQISSFKAGDILVLAGSVPESLPVNIYEDIMKRLDKGIKVIVDAQRKLLLNTLKCNPFLIKPNIYELEELFQTEIKNTEEIIYYAQKLKEKGAKNVLISMAGNGAVLVDETGQVLIANTPSGKVVNSVGAGDSMVAGFIFGYLKYKNYKDAFKIGICTGSASAFSEELATNEEVIELLKLHKFDF